MKKIISFFIALGLLAVVGAGAVFAYSGSHNFLKMAVVTSDGHSYKSEYRASGSFPFNGLGLYDKARVNLVGALNVFEVDSVPATSSSCAKLKGTLGRDSGKLTAIRYSDVACKVEAERQYYTVSGYSEDGEGNFNLVAKDQRGVTSTVSGMHNFLKN